MNVRLYAALALTLVLAAPARAQEPAPAPTDSTTAAPTAAAISGATSATPGPAATATSGTAVTAPPSAETPTSTPPSNAKTAAAAATVIDTSKDYRIGPEDVLDVLVWKQENLSRTVPVRPDGKVSLPLVNDIVAAGLTPSELRQQITERLTEYVPSPEVSVIVKEVHSVKVAVLGAVKMPGHYEVKSPATVLELIARAQGLTEFANRDRIVVLRQNSNGSTRVPFNYRKVADGSEQDNFFVRAGDIIVVP
jgi:polysaccharide export outer membrane protein